MVTSKLEALSFELNNGILEFNQNYVGFNSKNNRVKY